MRQLQNHRSDVENILALIMVTGNAEEANPFGVIFGRSSGELHICPLVGNCLGIFKNHEFGGFICCRKIITYMAKPSRAYETSLIQAGYVQKGARQG